MFRARQRLGSGVRGLFGPEPPPHGGAACKRHSVVRLWQGLRTKPHFTLVSLRRSGPIRPRATSAWMSCPAGSAEWYFEDEDAARGATGLPKRGKRWWSGHYEMTLRNAAVAAVNVTTARPAVTPNAFPIAFQSQPVLTNARTASTM